MKMKASSGILLILLFSCFPYLLYMPSVAFSSESSDWNFEVISDSIPTFYNMLKISDLVVDSKGITHMIWTGKNRHLYYANSSNWNNTIQLPSLGDYEFEPVIDIDSNDVIHLVWMPHIEEVSKPPYPYSIYYTNSTDWSNKVKIADSGFSPNVRVDSNNIAHISYVGDDIFYTNSSSNWAIYRLSKPSHTTMLSMDVDSKGIIHMAWVDWRWGIENGVGQYKVLYANSLDWSKETLIADEISKQSHGPALSVDSNDVVHIAWKDSRNTIEGFDEGDVYYANSLGTWENIRITKNVTKWFSQGESVEMHIDSNDVIHLAWTEELVRVRYTNSLDWSNQETFKPGTFLPSLWVHSNVVHMSLASFSPSCLYHAFKTCGCDTDGDGYPLWILVAISGIAVIGIALGTFFIRRRRTVKLIQKHAE